MQRHVQHVGSIILVLIFLDVILVARGQLQPNFDGQLPRLPGQQNDPGPLNGNGPPPASSVNKNPESGNGEQFLRNPFSKTKNYKDKYSVGICRDGWVAATMNNAAVCISINKDLLTWEEARDSCRENFGFLLKLEAPVTVEQENIKDYLRKLSLDSLWTGLHEENNLLVWDELAPHKVRPYNDLLELKSVPKRIWDWDISDDINGTDVCGELDIKNHEEDEESLVRKRRAPEEQSENGDMFSFTKNSKENENMNAFLMNNMRDSELQLRNFRKGKNNNIIQFNPANIRQKSASENIALLPKTQASETLDRINQNADPYGLQSEASENLRDMLSMLPSLSEAQDPPVTAETLERTKHKKTSGMEDTINQFQRQLGIHPFENTREPGNTMSDGLEQPSLALNPSESPLEARKTTLTSNLEQLQRQLGIRGSDSSGLSLDHLRGNHEGQSGDGGGETNNVTPSTEDSQSQFAIVNENSDIGNSNIPSLEELQAQHSTDQQTESQGEAFHQMDLSDLEKRLQLQQRNPPRDSSTNRKPVAQPRESSTDMRKALESLQRQLGIRPSETLNARPSESTPLQQKDINNNEDEKSPGTLKAKGNIESIAGLASLLTTNDPEEIDNLPGIQPPGAPKDIAQKAKSTAEKTLEHIDSLLDKDNFDDLKISPFNTPIATKTNMEITTINNIDKPVAFTLFTTETPDIKESDNMVTVSSPVAIMQSEEDHSSKENMTHSDDKSIQIGSTIPAVSPVVGLAITQSSSEYEKIAELLPDTFDGSNNDTTNSTDDLDPDDSIEDPGNPSIIGIVSTSTKQPDSEEEATVVTTQASASAELDSTLPPIFVKSTVSHRESTPGIDSSTNSSTYKEEVEPTDGEDDYYEEEEEEISGDKNRGDKGKVIDEIKDEMYDEKEESSYVSTPNVLGIISTNGNLSEEVDDNSTELNDMEEELSKSTRKSFIRNITFFSPGEYELSSNESFSDTYNDEDDITNYLDDDDSYEISDNRTQTEETNEALVTKINDEFDEINLGNSTDDYEEDLEIEGPSEKTNEAVVNEKSHEFEEISIGSSTDDFNDDLDVEAASLFPESQTEDQELPDDDRQEFVLPANIKEHIQRSSLRSLETQQNKVREVKANMKLSECQIRRPSVCYSPAIIVDSKASTCPSGWHGHIFIDKCYKVIISAMPFADARLRCQREGGGLANMNSLFRERLVLMTIWKSQRDGLVVGTQSTFWVQKEASNGLCVALTVNGFLEVPCNTPAEVVCERPVLQLNSLGSSSTSDREDDKEEDDQDPEHITLSADSPNNTLNCGLTVTAKELPTLWFKDGQLVNIKLQQRSESLMSMLGVNGRPLSPLPEPALTKTTDLEMDTMLRKTLEYSTSHHLGSEMFQGTYWCEVWDIKPFKKRRSKPYEIRYSDVITFKGSVEVPHLSNEEALLHNMINKENVNIKNVMKDIKFIHEKIFPALRKNLPTLESASTYGGELNKNNPKILNYNAFLKMSDNYSTAQENMAYTLLHRQLREVMGNTKFLLTLPGGTPLHVIRSIHIKSTVACPMTRLRDKVTGYTATFPRSSTDFVVNSVEVCDGKVSGSAKCKGDYYTGAYWDEIKISQICKKQPRVTPSPHENSDEDEEEEEEVENEEEEQQQEIISEDEKEDDGSVFENMSAEDRLKELAEMEMEDNNVESIMEETADIVEHVEEITAIDVDYIADIMDKTVTINKITREVGENILKTMDKVMKIDEDEIERANQKTAATNRILKSFEKCAENIYMDDGNIRLVQPNVAMEVWKFNSMTAPIIGMAAKQGKGKDLTDIFREDRIYTIYNQSELYDDIDAAIELPPELIKETLSRSGNDETRLYMMVYRDGRLFKGSTTTTDGSREDITFDSSLGRLNSYVISASIGGKKIQGLINKVKTVFRPLQDVAGEKRTCAFWDFTLNNQNGGWSSEGCIYDGQLNGRDICLCDHLTNFAVLIDFYGQAEPIPDHHEFSLSIISLVGLSLSILGLSLTIISYAFFKKLRQGRAQQTLFNLALAMLCSWVVFLTGIRQTHSYVGCILVAVLLHYFILASFMWMLMEAFLQYLTFVKVLGTYVTRYTLKTVIVAWGVPLIPIIVVLSIDHTLYRGGDRYCWMALPAFYYAFAAPIGLIILCNLAVFVITVFSICNRPNGLRSNQSKQKIALTNLQAAITSFVLLGLTWLLGYLAISDARLVFQYAFTILNTLQGFFIFVLFVARKKQVRDQWLIACCCKTPKQEKASRSLSASASIPSTCSGRSSYSGRSERSDSTKTTTSFMNDFDSIYTLPYARHSRESLFYRKDGYNY